MKKFKKILVVLERPMVNPSRFKASKSALRAYEATLIILELISIIISKSILLQLFNSSKYTL